MTASLVRATTDGTLVFSSDGAFRYTPNTGFAGTDSFTYVVTDGVVGSPVETVTIHVTDTAPVASPLTFSTLHDQTLLVSADQGLLSNASDADNDPLTLSIGTQPSHGTLVWNADGSFQYTPNAHWAGVDSFTYSISDGILNTGTLVATLNVTDAVPTLTNSTFSFPHDTHLLVNAQSGLLSFANDADNDPLTITLLTQPTHGTLTTLPDGAFKYIPNTGYAGTDYFTYSVNDGVYSSPAATVILNVTNSPPVAANLDYSVNYDTTLAVPAWTTGTGVQGVIANSTNADNDPLTLTVLTQPTDGTLQMMADGGFLYTPNTDFVGTDSFTYKLFDGAALSNVATVDIVVHNDPPVVPAMTFNVDRDSILSITDPTQGALANAYDPENDPTIFTLNTSTTHGSLTINPDGTFLYQPNVGFVGADSFTFSVSDGVSTTTTTDTLNVIDSAPTAQNVTYNVSAGTTLTLTGNGVLGNASDANGDPLTAIATTQPSNGTLSFNSKGTFSYTPNAGATTDSFDYQAFDGRSYSNAAIVTFNIVASQTATQLTVALASRTSANAAAQSTFNQAILAANITRIQSEFSTLTGFATTARSDGATFTSAVNAATLQAQINLVTTQAADDAAQAAALASYTQSQQATDDTLWSNQANADQTYYASMNSAALTAASSDTTSAVLAQNGQAAADATFQTAQNNAFLTQQANNASAEDAFETASVAAQQAYQAALVQPQQQYQAALSAAVATQTAAFGTAQSTYQASLTTAQASLQSTQASANLAYQTTLAGAQQFLTSQLANALSNYNGAVALAASEYGTPSSTGGTPTVTADPGYQAAVTAARATYAAAVDAANAAYNSASNAAHLVQANAVAAAQVAQAEQDAAALTTEQAAQASAASTYQAALVTAQVAHDQALTTAQTTYHTALSTATATLNTSLQSANQTYDNAVTAAQTTWQNATDAAQAAFATTQQNLTNAYATTATAADQAYTTTLQTDQTAYNNTATAALAAQNSTIQQAGQQFVATIATAMQTQAIAQQKAQATFNAVTLPAQVAYNVAQACATASALSRSRTSSDSATFRASLSAISKSWAISTMCRSAWSRTNLSSSSP